MKFSPLIRPAVNVILLLVLLAFAVYLEKPRAQPTAEQKCTLVENADADESGAAYTKLLSSGYREVRSRRITLAPLGETTAPAIVLNNVCEQRWYLARFVQRLSDAGAAVIVIDKFFAPDSCPKGDKGTSDLLRAIQISAAPVVVGAATHPPATYSDKSCLILSPSLDFGTKPRPLGEPAVYFGLTRLNADPRKIPINWYVFKSDQEWKANDEPADDYVGTLSYAAAALIDPGLGSDSQLRVMRENGRHPFTSFIDWSSMPRISAVDLLCAGPDKAEIASRYSITCADHPWNGPVIRGQVIVVGDDIEGRDRHMLFGDDVPGVYLQANYIESLLDGRYVRPFNTAWSFWLLVAWLVMLFLLFWLVQPELALLICAVILCCAWYVSAQLVVWRGIYVGAPLQTLGFFALLAKYVDARGHRIAEHIHKGHATTAPPKSAPSPPA